MTILSPMIMIALIAVVAYLSQINNNKQRTISVLDESDLVSEVFKKDGNITFEVLQNVTLDEAIALVKAKEHYGLLYIPNQSDVEAIAENVKFYYQDSPSLTIMTDLESTLEKKTHRY